MVLGDEREDDAENGNGKDRKNQLSELSCYGWWHFHNRLLSLFIRQW